MFLKVEHDYLIDFEEFRARTTRILLELIRATSSAEMVADMALDKNYGGYSLKDHLFHIGSTAGSAAEDINTAFRLLNEMISDFAHDRERAELIAQEQRIKQEHDKLKVLNRARKTEG